MAKNGEVVCVTGGSGAIGSCLVSLLLDRGYTVHATVKNIRRIKQKRGYKDQWPWNIKIYTDEKGNNKGDGVLSYEDPSAAHSAGGFYNNYDMRGHKINVSMAEKSAPKFPPSDNGGRGGYGGDRRRDSGPDRHQHGGNRSCPY